MTLSTSASNSRFPPLRLIWRLVWPAIDHFVSDKGFIYAGYIAFASLFALLHLNWLGGAMNALEREGQLKP